VERKRSAEVCVFGQAADFVGRRALGFRRPEQLAGLAAFAAAGRVAVRYLRIFSNGFGPIPRMAIESFKLLNAGS